MGACFEEKIHVLHFCANAHGGGDGTHMPALEVEQMLDYGPLSCNNKPFNVEPLSDDFVR